SGERVVGPVHVVGVDRHPNGGGRAGDEVLVSARPVQVRPADRASANHAVASPVDVPGTGSLAPGGSQEQHGDDGRSRRNGSNQSPHYSPRMYGWCVIRIARASTKASRLDSKNFAAADGEAMVGDVESAVRADRDRRRPVEAVENDRLASVWGHANQL